MKRKTERFVVVVTILVLFFMIFATLLKSAVVVVVTDRPCPVELPVQKEGWEDSNDVAGKHLGSSSIIWGEKLQFVLNYCYNEQEWEGSVNGYELPDGADVNDLVFTWTPDESQVGNYYLYFHLNATKGDRSIVSDVGTYCVRVYSKPLEFVGVTK